MITGKKILITGATGEVAREIALSLVGENEVWCLARFSEPGPKARMESVGIKTFRWTLGDDDFTGLPDDFDHVIHSACNIFPVANDYDAAIRTNAEGTGLLLAHCHRAKSLLYVSSLQVYVTPDDLSVSRKEDYPLGSHALYAPSYGIGKVATEAVVRTLARIYNMPTTIGRLGMNYGIGVGGAPDGAFRAMLSGKPMPVPPRGVSYCSLINNEDVVAQVEPLLNAASVPAMIVNWCGDEAVDERDMYDYLAEIGGLKPDFQESPGAGYHGGVGDPAKRISITGPGKYTWKDGILRAFKANFPDHRFVTPESGQ